MTAQATKADLKTYTNLSLYIYIGVFRLNLSLSIYIYVPLYICMYIYIHVYAHRCTGVCSLPLKACYGALELLAGSLSGGTMLALPCTAYMHIAPSEGFYFGIKTNGGWRTSPHIVSALAAYCIQSFWDLHIYKKVHILTVCPVSTHF
jgi:hypothetical protein